MTQSNLKRFMKSRKYTTKMLAEEIGVSARTLEPYVAGRRSVGSMQLYLALEIATALGVKAEELIG